MKQPDFFDVEERLARLSGLGDQLEAFSRTVDFEVFRRDLNKAVAYSDGSKGGRPPFDPVLMFKILIVGHRGGHKKDPQRSFRRMFHGHPCKDAVCCRKGSPIVSSPHCERHFNSRRRGIIPWVATDLGGNRKVRCEALRHRFCRSFHLYVTRAVISKSTSLLTHGPSCSLPLLN